MIASRRFSRRSILYVAALVIIIFWWKGVPRFHSRHLTIKGILYRSSTYDWANLRLQYPVTDLRPMPEGSPMEFPKVQHDFTAADQDDDDDGDDNTQQQHSEDGNVNESRRNAVLHAFRRSWDSYKEHAWTWDELRPVSGRGKNTFGGFAATLVDSLDTLWIMGMHDDFQQAVRAVATIDWDNTTLTSINMFETTIRHLGGLLAAYDLSGEPVLLAKAVELGDMLYLGFDTASRMPPFWFEFAAAKLGTQKAGDRDPSASGCSLSLEFTRLSQLTGNPKYYDATERVKEFLRATQHGTKAPGIWPVFLDYRNRRAQDTHFSIGGQADSLYEYLPKMHALLGGLDRQYAAMAEEALDAIAQHLLFRPMVPDDADILFPGNARYNHKDATLDLDPEMQHLSCFAGGMYGLASRLLGRADYMPLAEKLTRGCVWAYAAFPLGVMPEISSHVACAELKEEREPADKDNKDLHAPCTWDEDVFAAKASRSVDSSSNSNGNGNSNAKEALPPGFRSVRVASYLLRPEAIESVFYMWRLTGDKAWREAAWAMFQAIVAATETPLAYSSIRSVDLPAGVETDKTDSMESFWFSETLKYFYLVFSNDTLISLDEWVLNTEAHPLKRPLRTS
ncbi:endoplasmic reticulum mannosyl-oligosaccharide 1,2-alpha-mannosidase [Sodiomyces alkalinus F11]|uniref:alpha-1,2-Mannosidase n=1 Tax=Sodiomyces alkalinus (strain CBS 110278 / VKM F-3762 / F11) TaxID=1314773 RepID=A0A3N2Q3A5_SODAK|nr:endoplasmic reticulum mannosyl-oligosaccharide 1,2-alpha-mannosidase [Sodiomyces alkalinus F11]ROT41251.1 endoplasmic reticulum mannosyl-oligosaccharide 1,2-alpha-mannosidase [Sodiomyces alkalinus F11]